MWHSETLFHRTDVWLDALCAEIDRAREAVQAEFYIFARDRVGQRLLSHCLAAAARGVEVRLVIDGIGSPDWDREALLGLSEQGVAVRVYNPPPRPIGWFYDFWLPRLHLLPAALLRLNRRTHRKIVLIDERSAWIGSQNIGARFLEWRECNCRVSGPSLAAVAASLERIWRRAVAPGPQRERRRRPRPRADRLDPAVRSGTDRRSRRRQRRQLLARIRRARRRVWLTTAYFVPTPRLALALRRAARNGAEVVLLLPRRSDHPPVRAVARMHYSALLAAGVRIHEYLPAVLHAKSMVIDDWAAVGSTNLNHRSFYHDLEIDIVLERPASHRALRTRFATDLAHSAPIDPHWLARLPWRERVIGHLGKLLRRWL